MDYQSPAPYQAPTPTPSHSFSERIIGALRLERPTFDEVRRDVGAMSQAAILIGVTGFASGLGNYYSDRSNSVTVDDRTYEFGTSIFAAIVAGALTIVLALIFWVIISLIYRFVALRMLGSSETNIQWQEVARPIGFAAAPGLLSLFTPIPLLGALASLVGTFWGFAAQIVALSQTFQVSKLRAFGIIVVSAILIGLVIGILGCICVLAILAVA
jgi:hypothetical protein